jgi:crossover junction endodeoxyribonuclease RuvC
LIRILGVDPGSRITGFGVVDYNFSQIQLVSAGTIRADVNASFPVRLKTIYDGIFQIINEYQPLAMAVESAFYSQNIQSTLKLGQVRGVIMLAGANLNLQVVDYSPRRIKLAVTGNGAASKEQIKRAILQLFKDLNQSSTFDVTDALGIAVCHCHQIKNY